MNGRGEPGTEAGWRVIDAAVRSAERQLGDELLSAYAIGSLAHGGFSAAASDVDLALLTDDRAGADPAPVLEAIGRRVAELPGELAQRLSIFHAPWSRFADPPPGARFPPIDRYDLVHHGVLVHGEDLRSQLAVAPGAREIRAQAVESALRRLTPAELAKEVERLATAGVTVRDATKLVLWPVRLQHVCDTGTATGNADAVAHYVHARCGRHVALVTDALGWRDEPVLSDPGRALERIHNEIWDLHAEIFERLGGERSLSRRRELAERAGQLARPAA